MNPAASLARSVWFRYWGFMRAYHRYEVRGLENLDGVEPALIVGYHGRPFAHDLCMLQSLLYATRKTFPSAVVHDAMGRYPMIRELIEGLGLVTKDDRSLASVLAEKRSIVVTPGGTREACRSYREQYRVDWGERLGYLRLAVQHDLPVVPTAAEGTDEAYVGLANGYRLGKRWDLPAKLAPFLGLGPLGFWPFSPPFPVKIVQFVGAPIRDHLEEPPENDPKREERRLKSVDRRIRRAVQSLLDRRGGQ